MVLSRRPFTAEQLQILHQVADRMGFGVVLAPGHPSTSRLLNTIVGSSTIDEIDRAASNAYLDLSVPTDNRPFFFNQLKLSRIGQAVTGKILQREQQGVLFGNLLATVTLILIFVISAVAVFLTILLPLRGAMRNTDSRLITAGTSYFFLIGLGFMLAEISMLQYFSVYLGHPVYSLGVSLFSLILATGLGSLASGRMIIGTPFAMLLWGGLSAGYLLLLQATVAEIFQATTDQTLLIRIGLSVAMLCNRCPGIRIGCNTQHELWH